MPANRKERIAAKVSQMPKHFAKAFDLVIAAQGLPDPVRLVLLGAEPVSTNDAVVGIARGGFGVNLSPAERALVINFVALIVKARPQP